MIEFGHRTCFTDSGVVLLPFKRSRYVLDILLCRGLLHLPVERLGGVRSWGDSAVKAAAVSARVRKRVANALWLLIHYLKVFTSSSFTPRDNISIEDVMEKV